MVDKFDARINALPLNRRKETVIALRGIIKDMHAESMTVSEIARRLGKDHTTVLYHYFYLGLSASDAYYTERIEREAFKAHLETKKLERQLAIRESRKLTSMAAKKVKQLKDNQLKKDRALVLKLYKKGLSYKGISNESGIPAYRIQSLLTFSDEWHKIKRNDVLHNTARPVIQMKKDGTEIKRWKSMNAVEESLGIPRGGISMVCRGRGYTLGGFKWKYADI